MGSLLGLYFALSLPGLRLYTRVPSQSMDAFMDVCVCVCVCLLGPPTFNNEDDGALGADEGYVEAQHT